MLIKYLTLGNGTYRQVLKRRIWVGVAAIAFGLTAIVVALTLLKTGVLPDFIKGFYFGFGCGIAGGGLVLTIHSLWLMSHEERARVEEIKENDERERAIEGTAARYAYYISFFLLPVALLIAAPLNLAVFFTLLAVMAVMAVSLLVGLAVLRRRM